MFLDFCMYVYYNTQLRVLRMWPTQTLKSEVYIYVAHFLLGLIKWTIGYKLDV